MSNDPIENWVHETAERAAEHMGKEWVEEVLRRSYIRTIKDIINVLSLFNDTCIVRNKKIDDTIEEYNRLIEILENKGKEI